MAIIFYLSSQPVHQSNNLSKKVTKVVVETVEKVASKVELNSSRANHILRKNAHFFSCLVLGLLMMNALRVSKRDMIKSIVFALLFCILYAILDELHQLFVPGRGAQVKDVIIDTSGAIVGILLYGTCNYYIINRKR